MSDEQLSQYLPRHGDRIAVSEYCSNKNKRKESLLQKLRMKWSNKYDNQNRTIKDSVDDDQPKGKKNKKTRFVEIGWLCSTNGDKYVQVRTKQGGGTRKLEVDKMVTCNDLISLAIPLFFPNGISTKGHISKFSTKLFDFKSQELAPDWTVGKIYEVTGLSKLRFYLATKEIVAASTSTYEPTELAATDSCSFDSLPYEWEDISNLAELPKLPKSAPDETSQTTDFSDDLPLSYLLRLPGDSVKSNQELSFHAGPDFCISENLKSSTSCAQFVIPTLSDDIDFIDISINRDSCVEQLINFYADEMVTEKKIRVTFTNETGVDGGGLTKELFNLFFQKAETEFFKGENCIVPHLPLYRQKKEKYKFQRIGRAIEHMLLNTGTVPVKIAKTTFMMISDPNRTFINEDLMEDFLQYVNPCEKHIIKKALNNFSSLNKKEMEILINIFCSQNYMDMPKEKEIVEQIATIA